jgi:thioredoxin-like negative regulator of GroEL
VLLAFTTSWCSRCLALSPELDAASMLLASADSPVVVAVLDIDDPHNRPIADSFRVAAFPIGKIFRRGHFAADFSGGTQVRRLSDRLRPAASSQDPAHAAGSRCPLMLQDPAAR